MFRKILVPLDFTEENEPAVALAVEMAERDGAEALLLHVVALIRGVPFEEMRDFYSKLERRAIEQLAEVSDRFRKRGVAVRQEVVFGHRAERILAHAREQGADLILLSSHRVSPGDVTGTGIGAGNGPLAALGSISHRIAVFAECPVLLVK
jgi:nucleotide-binding universal stress UspA family protein